jgi:hypothetical protein
VVGLIDIASVIFYQKNQSFFGKILLKVRGVSRKKDKNFVIFFGNGAKFDLRN